MAPAHNRNAAPGPLYEQCLLEYGSTTLPLVGEPDVVFGLHSVEHLGLWKMRNDGYA